MVCFGFWDTDTKDISNILYIPPTFFALPPAIAYTSTMAEECFPQFLIKLL